MQSKKFSIEFTFLRKKQTAICELFQVVQKPQIRVAVDRGRKRADIFTFYVLDAKKKELFWYELPEIKQEVAKVIAERLKEEDLVLN